MAYHDLNSNAAAGGLGWYPAASLLLGLGLGWYCSCMLLPPRVGYDTPPKSWAGINLTYDMRGPTPPFSVITSTLYAAVLAWLLEGQNEPLHHCRSFTAPARKHFVTMNHLLLLLLPHENLFITLLFMQTPGLLALLLLLLLLLWCCTKGWCCCYMPFAHHPRKP